jgi:glyoxylase-like metal-dependent hydrolase (beta-lactamase superfamily II)
MALSSTSTAFALPAEPEFLQRLPQGITVVDTGFERPRFDAAYLLVDSGRAAFIDTGHNAAVPRLLAALRAAGLGVDAVDWVIPTHVHLDHAGGAGLLMQHLPKARLLKHPRGAPHMIDPGALIAGAEAVYGAEAVARTYGVVQPIDEARVVASDDGMTVTLGSRTLTLIHTPGHARHHHCIWDAASRGWFTGDTFGIAYRELDTAAGPFIFPTTTPVQFEPQPLRESIARLMQREPEVMYLTHYGPLHGVPRLAQLLLEQIDRLEALALRLATVPDRHARLREAVADELLAGLRRQGSTLDDARLRELLAVDIELNAQGVGIWLDRRR